jgi:uroporphyrinogen III methyltransferase/synthase
MKAVGKVYLVGAGPGDAQLLTLRGAELLRRADVVVYDSLVNRELLRLAPKTAALVARGKHTPEGSISQAELTTMLARFAREGKCVVRLKGGDPYVFGRGGEEAEGLAASGIPFEVVPGVSSVSAAPSYAGIPLTHRGHCSGFTVITGHEDPAKDPTGVDWARLARANETLVILMGAERIAQLAATLRQHGMKSGTPVAMVRWGTTGRQQTVTGTLEDIAARAAAARLTAPVVTVIGGVVSLRESLNWFEARPLFGQRIVVTRARDQAQALAQPLRERGADILEVPTIKLAEPSQREPLIEALAGLGCYEWIIFTSANGVAAFFDFFFRGFEDLRDLGAVRIAAVGPATAAKLKELHLKVDLMPKEYVAKDIAHALKAYESIENLRMLLVRAEVASPELPRLLEDLGAIVDDVPCYRTVAETDDSSGDAAILVEEGADWITFTSGSTVENFHSRFDLPKMLERFPRLRLASIGPETSKALAALGLTPALEAAPHTVEGLVAGLERAVTRSAENR